jgi:hypothetical protein
MLYVAVTQRRAAFLVLIGRVPASSVSYLKVARRHLSLLSLWYTSLYVNDTTWMHSHTRGPMRFTADIIVAPTRIGVGIPMYVPTFVDDSDMQAHEGSKWIWRPLKIMLHQMPAVDYTQQPTLRRRSDVSATSRAARVYAIGSYNLAVNRVCIERLQM